jgi:hypothetical protein
MTQLQREAIAGMLRASPFDPAGDLREQRPLFEKMISTAPVRTDVANTLGNWVACRSSASTFPAPPPVASTCISLIQAGSHEVLG